jgi:adenine-specific DNA-methyltransferase
MSNYSQLKDVLNDIFELNKADLDFGIYRIINQKRKQVNEFIDKKLPEDIKTALSETQSVDKTELESELKTLKKNLDDAGMVAEDSPKYKKLSEQLKGVENTDGLEQEVFSHLANFFRRYYKDGDFISMRRYKKDVYAIPYEGEEVKLHWANHDQYYIKSSENFKQYSFTLPDGKRVTFQLKEVSTEQSNNKIQGDAERRFALYQEQPVEGIGEELFINFIYEPFQNGVKQDVLLNKAVEVLTEDVPAAFAAIFTLNPTEKNKSRTLLEKHLGDYIAKNSFDYFIHKDLGGFLSRELDFYIKNEVLYIDDINTIQTDFFVAQLSKVKAIKVVAQKIIDFLAQIENFQKKLWLKKKFIIRTDYCITLDRIPSSYYAEIVKNKAQLAEWKELFDVEVQNESQLVFEQHLQLDTKFFNEQFKDRLLAEFDNLDEQTTGLLINSDNFQAINLLQERHQGTIQGIYIDPPYNTSASEIVYKNSFRDSSWLSLINDRLSISLQLLKENGNLCVTIDDFEKDKLKLLLDGMLGKENELGVICIRNNPSGRSTSKGFSIAHEYGLFYSKSNSSKVGRLGRNEKQTNRYDEMDSIGAFEWVNFRKHGGTREESSSMYYPFFVSIESYRLPEMKWEENNKEWILLEKPTEGERLVYPVDERGIERRWKWGIDRVRNNPNDLSVRQDRNGEHTVYCKARINDEGILPLTWWDSKEYSATAYGTNLIKELFNSVSKFSYPKSIFAVVDSLKVLNIQKNDYVLDFFSGSGSTAHATIKYNREDGGNRKFILVEMGTYFNTVTKPRIQKVIYSDNWKNGKPQDKGGISQIVKYQVLESYEDTLNNLQLSSTPDQAQLDFSKRANEEYLLQYMLEIESRQQLFNLEMFRKPFDYQLKITENNELKPTKVDLVETFNYLIGLYVSKVQRVKDIKVVEGVTRTGIKTLVIWRDMETTTNEEVEKLIRRFYDSQRTKEFQQIYINGDHHLENIRLDGDDFKIKLTEETFFKKMFNEIEL